MVVARKIAYNVLVSTVTKVLSTILALVSIGFITRYLGKEGFGNYATVLAFLSFFTAIADLGLYFIATREISRDGAHEAHILGNIFAIRLVSSAVVFLASPLVVYFFDYPAEVKRGIIIAAASFMFSSSYQILNGVFQKNLAMDKVAVSELLGKIVQVIFVIGAIQLKLGFDWIMLALLANMMVNFGVIYLFLKKYIIIKLQFDFVYWKSFLKESLPMGIAAVIAFIYFKMDTILLSVMKSSADVGIYNVAYKVLENITFFPAMIAGLVMPIMAKNIFSNRERFLEVTNKTLKVFFLLIVPLIVGVSFLADDIIRLIGGSGFFESGRVLQILVFALALIFFGQLLNTILIVGNLQKKLMWILGGVAIFNIGANLFFIPSYSYMASSYISVATELLVVLLTGYVVMVEIKYIPQTEGFLKIMGAGLLMASFLYSFRALNFFVLALGSSAIYFIFLWLFKAVKTEELTSLIRKN